MVEFDRHLKRTGRTTRMVLDAYLYACKPEVNHVLILVGKFEEIKRIRGILFRINRFLGNTGIFDKIKIDIEAGSFFNGHPHDIFIDHYYLEQTHGDILESLHKYDAQPTQGVFNEGHNHSDSPGTNLGPFLR